MNIRLKFSLLAAVVMVLSLASCDNTQSYGDLLKNEQKVSNWFLAQQTVCNEIPADSVFITGPDAPYYKMDDDGYVYMQVLSCPDKKDRVLPEYSDQVYFTFTRWNIITMYIQNTTSVSPDKSNQDNYATDEVGDTYFLFNNYSSSVSSYFGSGIQLPVSYLGYNSEVNLVLKSYYGFSTESSTCVPFKINARYFKAEY